MKRRLAGILAFAFVLGLNAPVVLAYHCPKLVNECRALAGKMEKRKGGDMAKVAEAKAGCEEAWSLHQAGKHKESVIKAGEAISAAGQSVK
ncbi:MAG: hypothetical protein FVQ06_05535 [candidate division NC10 bacterium]|nr:hypothetical protein [candidate division NC10 bacterium]